MTDRMLRTVIVEDEPLARERLKHLLGRHRDIQVTAEAATISDGLDAVRNESPDVLLLDVQLGESSGFDLLGAGLGGESSPSVIFTTAHENYAVRAFRCGAVHYLLKPLDARDLDEALDRIRASRDPRGSSSGIGGGSVAKERIGVRVGDRVVLVRLQDIDYVESEGNYLRLHTGARTYSIRSTVAEFLEQVSPRDFARISRGTIMNLDRVAEITRGIRRGEHDVKLKDGTVLVLRRGFASMLESFIGRM